MNPLILLAVLVGTASAQYTPYSAAFGSGLSPFSGSGLGAYSSFRPFSGFSGASSLYGGSPSLYGSASTSHPFYGSSPFGAGSSGPYASGPYTTSFSSQPQYSASLGSPHTMSKDPASPNLQTSSSSLYDRIPGMGGGGLISNLFRHRRPSLFGFRRGQPTAASHNNRLRPQNPLQAPAAGNFQYHPLPDPASPNPNPYPPYSYPNPGHYAGHHPEHTQSGQESGHYPNHGYDRDPEHHSSGHGPDPDQY